MLRATKYIMSFLPIPEYKAWKPRCGCGNGHSHSLLHLNTHTQNFHIPCPHLWALQFGGLAYQGGMPPAGDTTMFARIRRSPPNCFKFLMPLKRRQEDLSRMVNWSSRGNGCCWIMSSWLHLEPGGVGVGVLWDTFRSSMSNSKINIKKPRLLLSGIMEPDLPSCYKQLEK